MLSSAAPRKAEPWGSGRVQEVCPPCSGEGSPSEPLSELLPVPPWQSW